jgi:hypothetical protein
MVGGFLNPLLAMVAIGQKQALAFPAGQCEVVDRQGEYADDGL